jgi:hypothetical protein
MTTSGLGLSLMSRDVVKPEEHGHGRHGAMEVSRVRCEEDGDVELDMLLPTICVVEYGHGSCVFFLFTSGVELWRSQVGRGE